MSPHHRTSPLFDEHSLAEAFALECDRTDPLAKFRDRFHIPTGKDGRPLVYLAGNSLGLQPKGVRDAIDQELRDWAELGVEGHFHGKRPWYSYHELFRDSAARLVGALPGEVVLMNSLTVNLHLMMVSFYRPTPARHKILIDWPAFPSDIYAAKTQLQFHGHDAEQGLLRWEPRAGENTLRVEDVEEIFARERERIALLLLAGVNYFTGQGYDLKRIAGIAAKYGCVVGLDLAHAAGNVRLALHDWPVDFAVWCNYKYVNSGPGAVAGCFVHEKHHHRPDLPRFAGWWGNDPKTRFRMHLQPEFVPGDGADGWQVSNPPIFSLAPVRASLDLFDEAGMSALRAKSERLTSYLCFLIDRLCGERIEIMTSREPEARGCQLSLTVKNRPKELLPALQREGVVCDFREPNVVRAAPVPLYNTYHDVWRFAQILARHSREP